MPFLTFQSDPLLANALDHMEAALEILDDERVPAEIGATLDLAIARLRQRMGRDGAGASGMQALFSQLEDELSRVLGGTDSAPILWEISSV